MNRLTFKVLNRPPKLMEMALEGDGRITQRTGGGDKAWSSAKALIPIEQHIIDLEQKILELSVKTRERNNSDYWLEWNRTIDKYVDTVTPMPMVKALKYFQNIVGHEVPKGFANIAVEAIKEKIENDKLKDE